MTKRLYVGAGALDAGRIELADATAHRLKNVLRVRAGDELVLFDGAGTDALVRVDEASSRAVVVAVLERYASPREPATRVHLYQSITKGERFEWLLEKGTELGVARFVPLIAARSVVRTAADANRFERWRRIVVEAAEQSGRGAVPDVDPPQEFEAAVRDAPGVRLLPYERAGEAAPDIQAALTSEIDALFALAGVSVFIGPEGGFEDREVELAQSSGAAVVTMGQRVLRSETAGLVATTLVMQALGELG